MNHMAAAIRWNIKVSKKTDLTLRTFLESHGMKRGDFSKFIEQAVQAHVFHRTIQEIKSRNAGVDSDELQTLIDSRPLSIAPGTRATSRS